MGGYFFWGRQIFGRIAMRFDKPPLSYDEQLDRLIERGMVIADRAGARHYLQHLNYYRLGAYWLPFEVDHATHLLQPGTTFEQVLDLYRFDRELRLLVMDALERIEVSVRTGWAYHMAHHYGPHFHLDHSLFKSKWPQPRYRDKLQEEVGRSQETFIRHLRRQYEEPLPPAWALVEIMTFGQLSQWYGNTSRRADRNAVARAYGVDEKVLCSLLHHLTTVRNTCAHHGRLWNREFTVLPVIPNRGPQALTGSLRDDKDRHIYNTLTLMLHLMNVVNPGHHWRTRVANLIDDYNANTEAMGFPPNWRELPLWGE